MAPVPPVTASFGAASPNAQTRFWDAPPPPPPPPPPIAHAASPFASPGHAASTTTATRRKNRGLLIALIALGVVVVGLGAFLGIAEFHKSTPRASSSPGNGLVQTPGTVAPSATPPSVPTTDPATIAAQQLNSLLTQNAQNRTAVQGATQVIASCGDVTSAVQALQSGASSRQTLLTELAQTDLSALPDGAELAQDLTSAWQYSINSDDSYAQWGQDEQAQGCAPNDLGDSNYQAAQGTDAQATAAKQAFVNLWNPVASTFGLSQWQPDQI